MWLDGQSTIRKQDLLLTNSYVNAAGILGFAPDPRAMPFLNRLGAFITHPISRRPRQPAANRCSLPFPGGFLLHTGLANPGISRAVSRYRRRWASATLPIIVHLLAEAPETVAEMVQKLEGLENVLAVELGLPPECSPKLLFDFMAASTGELPVLISLGPEQVPTLLTALKALQPAAVHLTEPRGALPEPDGGLVSGRLYGPAIFPLMLSTAQTLVDAGLRVIADGGIYERWQAEALLGCGVFAVGLAGTLWGVDPNESFGKK
jgi:dihydroorotate dehydrogenase (NAD+) catalytic subunit